MAKKMYLFWNKKAKICTRRRKVAHSIRCSAKFSDDNILYDYFAWVALYIYFPFCLRQGPGR